MQTTPRRCNLRAACRGLLLLALAACTEPPSSQESESAAPRPATSSPTTTPVAHEPDAARGRALVRRFECTRCHAVPGEAEPPLGKQCVGCHAAIEDGSFEAPAPLRKAWRERLHSLPAAPSLAVARHLLKPSWIAAYLRDPHDLRPHLEATMPRLSLTESEASDMAAFLAGPDEDDSDVGDEQVAEGGALFVARGCGTCHAFTGAGLPLAPPPARSTATALAPDLRFARDRLRPSRLVRWLEDPTAVSGSHMPRVPLTRDEAVALASFVTHAPLAAVSVVAPPPRLPLLERPVGYEEVRERVFEKVCWHCHAQPDLARGDGGPGMSGGFGFPPRQLDLSTYEAIASGYLDADGEPRSLFSGDPPVLVAVLLARQREVAGAPSEPRGMPLGLPPIAPEDIQLIESWIAQGRPR